MKKKKGVEGKLDKAWSLLVKLRAGMKCEIQGCTHKPTLNSHHIFSRKNASTRWDVENGICLCVGHHTMSSKCDKCTVRIQVVIFMCIKYIYIHNILSYCITDNRQARTYGLSR